MDYAVPFMAMTPRTTLELVSDSEIQTMAIAAALGPALRGGEVIALEGPLGSGKTCFVRGLARGMRLNPAQVSSPTFVICQEYAPVAADAAGPTLVHIDAYRVNSSNELENIGWHELVDSTETVIAIEWPSRIASALPADRIDIAFEHAGEHSRRLVFHGPAALLDPLARSTPNDSGRQATMACRRCGKAITAGEKFVPFCSERCRMADLGRWFNESYRTSRQIEADEDLSE